MFTTSVPKPIRFLVMLSAAFLVASLVMTGVNAYVVLASPLLQQQSYTPSTVAFEGYLADSTGSPASGTHDLTFRLYSVDSGGTALWSEAHPGVSVSSKGLYAVQLGQTSSLSGSSFTGARWLSVQVDANAEMTPRIPISAVPWALNASQAQGLQGNPVDSTTPTANQGLVWNGSAWAPANVVKADGSVAMTGNLDLGGNNATNLNYLEASQIAAPSAPASGKIRFYDGATNSLRRVDGLGQDDALLNGDTPGYVTFSNTSTEQTLLTKTIKRSSLGTKGWVKVEFWLWVSNNTGANQTVTAKVKLGTYTLTILPATAFTTSATAKGMFHGWVTFTQKNAANAQLVYSHRILNNTALAPAAFGSLVWDQEAWDNATQDNGAGDLTLSVTSLLGVANANLKIEAIGQVIGPVNQ